jgi:hypothetical protein
MAKIYFRKKVLYAKVETTYGTDAEPAGSDAIQTRDLTITPRDGETITLDLDKPNFGADLESLVAAHVMVTFKVPLAGSGTAGTAPAWGKLMKGCGHDETVTESTSVKYTPADDDPDSLTLRFERDKVLHTITGARGSVKLTLDKRQYPWLEFSFMGIYNAVAANSAALTPVFTAWKKPVPFRASTVSCTLIGQTVGLHKIAFDFGQKVEFYDHSEEESIQITDRESRFDATFEETEIGTHDFFADAVAETTGVLTYVHGVTAGNIVTVASPLTQITKPTPTDVQGVSALQCTGPLVTDGTDPDYTITLT